MLEPPPLDTDLSAFSDAEPWAPYGYLLGDANPELSSATCLYFDGIPPGCSLTQTLDLVERWFQMFDSKLKVLLVGGDKQILLPRYSMRTLRNSVSEREVNLAIETIECFPKGRTTIDDTWKPSVYFASSLRLPSSAFFCVNATLSERRTLDMLIEGARLFKSCTAYGFLFPAKFSPLGYYWGISVEPSYRKLGRWGDRESRRISHWRDNAKIGILQGEEKRFYRACDGYVRDVYPLMLLGEKHLERRVGATSLADTIRQDSLGHLTRADGSFLWRVSNNQLLRAQQLLDANDITLSGRRIDM
jgi:hypothetical protein